MEYKHPFEKPQWLHMFVLVFISCIVHPWTKLACSCRSSEGTNKALGPLHWPKNSLTDLFFSLRGKMPMFVKYDTCPTLQILQFDWFTNMTIKNITPPLLSPAVGWGQFPAEGLPPSFLGFLFLFVFLLLYTYHRLGSSPWCSGSFPCSNPCSHSPISPRLGSLSPKTSGLLIIQEKDSLVYSSIFSKIWPFLFAHHSFHLSNLDIHWTQMENII